MVNLEQAIQSTKFKDQRHKASLNVMYTAWWLKTLLSRGLKEVGLTHEQYNVLRILKGRHPEQMCVRDIGERMIEKSSNVPRIIDRLQLKKYVDRSTSQHDKRETVITLSVAGIEKLTTATEKVESVFSEYIDISEQDALHLNTLLEELRKKEQPGQP